MGALYLQDIKHALGKALESLPDWQHLNPFDKGKIVDRSFKQMMKDLMEQFGMEPGEDYEANLRDNEESTDFVALSARADDLIQGLLDGKIVVVQKHTRVSRKGKEFIVQAHYRDLRNSA